MSPRAAARLQTLGFTEIFDYTAGKADWLANGLPVEGKHADDVRAGDLVDPEIPTCSLDDALSSIQDDLETSGSPACVVVDSQRVVLGLLRRDHLDGVTMDAQVQDVMEDGPSTFRPDDSPEALLKYMERNQEDRVLVTTTPGKLLGAASRERAQDAGTS